MEDKWYHIPEAVQDIKVKQKARAIQTLLSSGISLQHQRRREVVTLSLLKFSFIQVYASEPSGAFIAPQLCPTLNYSFGAWVVS